MESGVKGKQEDAGIPSYRSNEKIEMEPLFEAGLHESILGPEVAATEDKQGMTHATQTSPEVLSNTSPNKLAGDNPNQATIVMKPENTESIDSTMTEMANLFELLPKVVCNEAPYFVSFYDVIGCDLCVFLNIS